MMPHMFVATAFNSSRAKFCGRGQISTELRGTSHMLFFGCGRTVVGVAYHLTVGYLSSIADALDAHPPARCRWAPLGESARPRQDARWAAAQRAALVALGPRCGAPMLSRVISPLHTDFPHVKFSASDGQHWRVHGKGCEPGTSRVWSHIPARTRSAASICMSPLGPAT